MSTKTQAYGSFIEVRFTSQTASAFAPCMRLVIPMPPSARHDSQKCSSCPSRAECMCCAKNTHGTAEHPCNHAQAKLQHTHNLELLLRESLLRHDFKALPHILQALLSNRVRQQHPMYNSMLRCIVTAELRTL